MIDNRVGVVGIIVTDREKQAERVNEILGSLES